MSKTVWLLCIALALTGCQPQHDPPAPRKSSTTTTTKVMPKVDDPDAEEKPVADPEESQPKTTPNTEIKKTTPDPEPSAEDKALAALKDVPIDELVTKLGDEKERSLATRALATRGKDAVAPLVKALDSEDAQVRAAAAFTLGQLGDDAAEAKDRLKTMSESDESEIAKDAAAFALDALEGK